MSTSRASVFFAAAWIVASAALSEVNAEVDLSSPKATARSLYEAVERGDEDGIRRTLLAETDGQRDLADAFAKLIVSGKRFGDAAKARYGPSADAIAQGVVMLDEIERLESATVKETGETATLQTSQMSKPLRFRRSERGWQIELVDVTSAPDKLAEQIALTRDFAEAFDELAEEIAAGKHPTVQDAETAIQHKINDVMTQAARKAPPATGPTTAPSTAP